MNESRECPERERLVGVLYDDASPEERERVEQHLASCDPCRRELEELHDVRNQLLVWSPPADGIDLAVVPAHQARGPSRWMPTWGLAAAAVILLAVGAAVANLEVRVGQGQLVIRTGWSTPASAPAPAPAAGVSSEPWRTELAAAEGRLRADIDARQRAAFRAAGTVNASDGSMNSEELDRRMRALRRLVEESEAKQQRELALRMAQLTRELETQRRGDLGRIERGLGQLEGTAGAEAAQQRELLNYLVRVSQRR